MKQFIFAGSAAIALLAQMPVMAAEVWATVYHSSYHNGRTASGERFDYYGYTAASSRYPLGTQLQVSRGGRSVTVRVNDRCRCDLDLAYGAMRDLGGHSNWSGPVTVRVLR
ncbi:septal ring lytic transglycosylase RlpA family protein [Synechococcus elongatus IITB7]|uniref:septal ring lytic transglycosylase RlpA family protein n=1 Tax=Synechococcus elongatus TaxID=32046 RepID=UPI0030CE9C02